MEAILKERILELCRLGQRLEAVNLCKEITGLDLKSAKEFVDNLENSKTNESIMSSQNVAEFLYSIYPVNVDTSKRYEDNHKMTDEGIAFIVIAIIVEIILIIVALYNGSGSLWLFGLLVIGVFFVIRKLNNDSKDDFLTKSIILNLQNQAKTESVFYTDKLNTILNKSKEIATQILPYCEESAKQCIDRSKNEFSENAFSPFWSEIEKASKFLAYYKEAVDQLSTNSEIYTHTLKSKNHNFPIPFPYATNVSISQIVIDEYRSIIRKAQTNPTFSIIWEQRRNTEILIAGFTTLENAINNMSNDILSAISELNYTISSELNAIKHVQIEQLRSFETSQVYLNKTLQLMDTKLYYIQWKKRPAGIFYYR